MRAPLYSLEPDEILSAEAIDNPHRLYARLHEKAPLARVYSSGVHTVASWLQFDTQNSEIRGRDLQISR